MFAKYEITKYAVNTAVAGVVQNAVATIITNNTEKTEDDLVVKIPSAMVGMIVANRIRTHTDALVDLTAAKIIEFKNRKDTTE